MSYEISLVRLLENRDVGLYGRLTGIREKAQPLLSYAQSKFPYYTPHDFSHSAAVEENLNWLIPDEVKQRMNTFELFFLVVAAWFHDWGMIGEAGEDAQFVRDTHHIRTEKNFEDYYERLHLSEHEARIIGRISKGHRRVDLTSHEYDDVVFGHSTKIRPRFLAALLRLADECDITHNRTPEVLYYSINPKEDAEVEFSKHLSIAGIGQLAETHKIYISAIARDPKGARTLREVAQKVQRELDGVKAILSEHNVPLDIVELRLETRGFIDKPISFEMDRARIVQLLIGDHLYANQDVAIRELVQNSLDTCRLRQTLAPETPCRISLHKMKEGILVVEDNGLGMDYIEAKEFLSTIGSSFRNSEAFRERFAETDYTPIAKYGIGVLSCFLICDQMTIETYKEGQEPCRFTIESVAQEWRYEKGSRSTPGTQISLRLNHYGKGIRLQQSIERYFLCPEIPIQFKDGDADAQRLESQWAGDFIFRRFIREPDTTEQGLFREVLKLSGDKFDLILATSPEAYRNQILLFNHGIYVGGEADVEGLEYPYCVCVNMKTDLVDLLLSREGVKKNERWYAFVRTLFDLIFAELKARHNKELAELIVRLASMLSARMYFEVKPDTALLDRLPFVQSFLCHAPFLLLSDGKVQSVPLEEAAKAESLLLYNCCSNALSEELKLVARLVGKGQLLINPYCFPFVESKKDAAPNQRLLNYLFAKNGRSRREVDLRGLLIKSASRVESERFDILPKHVQLVTFPKGVHPLVVVKDYPVVETKEHMMGVSYWGNILLWKQLLGRARAKNQLDMIETFCDDRFRRLRLIEQPVVYLDRSDPFIKTLLAAARRNALDATAVRQATRYLNYLAYLPLVAGNLESCVIFLEVMDDLEVELSTHLNINRPISLLDRIKPHAKVFMQYFRRFGLNYREKELAS